MNQIRITWRQYMWLSQYGDRRLEDVFVKDNRLFIYMGSMKRIVLPGHNRLRYIEKGDHSCVIEL